MIEFITLPDGRRHPVPPSAHPHIPKRPVRQVLRQVARLGALPNKASSPGYIPDISEFQGAVDWTALANYYRSGTIQGVIMRASFGTARPDAQFYRNRDNARALGIPRAFYHYCYPDYNSAAAEAAYFNSVVGGLQASEAMIADFEEAGLTEAWAVTFMTDTESPQANTIWYGAPYFSSSVGLYALSNSWPYWVADYGVSAPPPQGSPAMWQYTDRGFNQWDTSVMLRGKFTDLLIPGGPSPAPPPPTPAQGVPTSMATICQHPTYANRYDRITLDPNDHADGVAGRGYKVWRQWSDTPWFPNGSHTGAVDTGGYLIPGTEYCWWERTGAWCMFGGRGTDGMEYVLGVDINGASVFGWGACGGNPLAVPLTLPYDDSGIKMAEAADSANIAKLQSDVAALQPANVSDLAARITKVEATLQAIKTDVDKDIS